ncbi:hypothetical protein B0H13DRAFT_2278935 [Mycena leptocephala]|nr:hypothetical protein B0H13DRAFT_2278935 [Mycena leptocephala]
MSATFGDVPVSAIFDGNAATSSLSLEWVWALGSVPGTRGLLFVCNSTFELVVHLSSGPLDLRHHPLPTVGGESIGSSSVTPVFRGDIGVDPSSSSSASQGRPDVVLTHSCTPGTRAYACKRFK